MACITMSGYNKGCDASVGGIKTVALFEKAGIDTTGVTIENGLIVSGLTMDDAYTGYTYDFLKDNSNFTQAIVGDGIMANVSWTPALNLVFKKMSASLRTEIYELSRNELIAIVLDKNGLYWLLGLDSGLIMTAGAGSTTGNLLTDLNGETILLQGAEPQPAYAVDISSGSAIDDRVLALFGF